MEYLPVFEIDDTCGFYLMLHALILRVKEAFNVNRLCTYPGCYGPHIRMDKTRYTTGQHLYGVSPLTSW